MIDHQNLPMLVCYPAGSGGSFVASALNAALFDQEFSVDRAGSCHNNTRFNFEHFVPSDDIESQLAEIALLQKNAEKMHRINKIFSDHIRNLVAVQHLNFDLWFVKITHDVESEFECGLISKMLYNKVDARSGLSDCYARVRSPDWPRSLEEFLKSDNHQDLYLDSIKSTCRNWYWIENINTRSRTIDLTLQDVFKGKISNKLNRWFDQDVCKKIDAMQAIYQRINRALFPELANL